MHDSRACRIYADDPRNGTASTPEGRYATTDGRWGADFDPDELARLEAHMWKACYRRRPARLFGLLVLALREQATDVGMDARVSDRPGDAPRATR